MIQLDILSSGVFLSPRRNRSSYAEREASGDVRGGGKTLYQKKTPENFFRGLYAVFDDYLVCLEVCSRAEVQAEVIVRNDMDAAEGEDADLGRDEEFDSAAG